jgi:hypothetical protein
MRKLKKTAIRGDTERSESRAMDPLQERALEAEEAGNLPAALELWKALVDKTGKVPCCIGYGQVAEKLKMWNEAEKAFVQALHGSPKGLHH